MLCTTHNLHSENDLNVSLTIKADVYLAMKVLGTAEQSK